MAVRSASTLRQKSRSLAPGSSLGLKTADVSQVATILLKGLPYVAIERLQSNSGLSVESIESVTQISPRTRARRKLEGKFSPHESERLYRLAVVFDKALALFEGDAEAARHWLSSESTALSNQSPLKMTETEIGAREVENLIGRLEHGVLT